MITWVFLRPARLVESRQIANQRQKRPGGALTGLTSSTTKAIKTTKKSFSFVIIIMSHSSSGKGCSRSHPQPSHRRPKEELTVPKVHQSRQGSPLVTFGSSEMAAQPPMMEVEAVNQEEGPENLDGGSRTRGGTPSSLGSTTGC